MLPLFDTNPSRRTPVVVLVFIIANVVLLVWDAPQRPPEQLSSFSFTWSLVPERLWQFEDGRVWVTPLTSMFLHAGWLHLAGNCWFLWLFGNNIEDRLGHVRFILFYVVCGLAAAFAQVAISPFSDIPMVGASGAISGVLAAYMRYFPGSPIFTLVPLPVPILPVPAFIFAGVWFIFQFWQGTVYLLQHDARGGVAWWAHIGGFLMGFWLAGVLRPKARTRNRARR